MSETPVVRSKANEHAADFGGRMKGVTIIKPIVYGNVAKYFGKKREEDGHTHQWTVYVKPYKNDDMSVYVKKVHFKLHDSYPNPNRVVTKPPYEVTESGWGEFEIVIKIYFLDPNERPITIYHILKLFQTDNNVINIKKHLVSEFYDELIFQDPSSMMHQLLTTTRQLTLGPVRHETDFEEKKEKTLQSVLSAKNKVKLEIADLKDRLKLAKDSIQNLKDELSKAQKTE